MTENEFHAQFGEDKILYELFDKKKDGVCVEVGGYDGITGSNTYFFEKLGWKCLIVEPMPDFCRKIASFRKCEIAEVAASDTKGEVTFYVAEGVETLSTLEQDADHFKRIDNEGARGIKDIRVKTDLLSNILLERGISHIDFLSLDVEGHELSALKGMPFDKIRPRIFIIEDNSLGFNDEIKKYMNKNNYIRFKRTGCNDWYAEANDSFAIKHKVMTTELNIFYNVCRRKINSTIKRMRSAIRKSILSNK